ncbi:MAG: hypothetical protein WKF95_11260 [Rubrobacter sp.]
MRAWILGDFSVIVFVSGSLGGIVSTLYMGGQVPGRPYAAARTDADHDLARKPSLASSDQAAQIAAKAASRGQPARTGSRRRARGDREPARGAGVT